MKSAAGQATIDRANAGFWDELCGSKFARERGITDASPESVASFDRAYLDYYPYLEGHLPAPLSGRRLLEIGLGFGTLGQRIAEGGADYHGLDIAPGPVGMMRERLRRIGAGDPESRVRQGSSLAIPHPDAHFDAVVSIGCLHHTGDIPGSVAEVHRVLRPGGTAVVMLYARHSFRRYALTALNLPALWRRGTTIEREVRRTYDQTLAGEPAPVVDFTSRREARRLFAAFAEVEVRRENFDKIKALPREWFLGWPARLAGVDLYVSARK